MARKSPLRPCCRASSTLPWRAVLRGVQLWPATAPLTGGGRHRRSELCEIGILEPASVRRPGSWRRT
jgi:hypothetical protein